MSIKLFITGATGYIGGDALAVIVEKHPDWNVTCLVRNSDKGAKIAQQYSGVRLVYGDLDSTETIEEEASKADIVYNFANCDHEPSAQAISKGLAQRASKQPCFWIHTSGTLILGHESLAKGLFGEALSKVYDDWDGIAELTSLPHEAPHRKVDEIVLAASAGRPNIKTAIVCPPTIYGPGRGPDNQRSMQAYRATESFLRNRKAGKVGKGQNIWHQVHIRDLSQLYLLLGEAATAGGSPATWNSEGYYLVENGEFVWGDILQEIATVAHKKGFLPSDQCEAMTEADLAMFGNPKHFQVSVGTNSRGISSRARNLLHWKPNERSLREEIPAIVDSEAKRLGLIRGHADRVEEESA